VISATDSGGYPHHINLARVYRGGERQTEILIRGLAAYLPKQRLITRRGMPLHERLLGTDGVEVVPVEGRLEALRATTGATLLHAHETRSAQVCCLRHLFSKTPYLITRRVDNRPRPDPVTRYMYRSADRVVVLSHAIEKVLGEVEPRARLERIPSVASGHQFDDAWATAYRESLGAELIVGQVAALDQSHKGQLTLIGVARRLAKQYPGVHFVFVGDGRDADLIREEAADLENVSFTGWVENVGDYLSAFDLFVLPSLREGFGSILLDAMQFGLPVVASAVGGIIDIVDDGKTGLLVPPGDSQALAEGILRLYQDAGLRNAMSEAARVRALGYRPEVMIERYWRLYQEIVPRLSREF